MKYLFILGIVAFGCGSKVQLREPGQEPVITSSRWPESRPTQYQIGPAHFKLSQNPEDPTQFNLISKAIDQKSLYHFVIEIIEPASVSEPRKKSLLNPFALNPFEQVQKFNQGEVLLVTVFCEQGASRSMCGQNRIIMPRVLVFNGTIELKEDFVGHFDQVWFQPEARVYTKGHQFNLKTDELIVLPGAYLATFSEAPAAQGFPGLNPNPLILFANKGKGELQIFNRGQTGGRGLKGLPILERAQKGNNGQNAQISTRYSADLNIHMEECIKFATNGEKGRPGRAGNKGGRGFTGGNTAFVQVEIRDHHQFKIYVHELPGQGGERGEGGDGQLGGLGGNPGLSGGICKGYPSTGPEGDKGPAGERGEMGLPGEAVIGCIILGNTRMGDCRDL